MRRYVLLALFGATAGQGVVWYTGQFYALFFLQNTLKLDFQTSYLLIAAALLIGTPFFVFFGRLSDRIGRKPIMVAGCLLAALTFIPIFKGLTHVGQPGAGGVRVARAAISVAGSDCRFHIFAKPRTACDQARDFLTKAGVSYERRPRRRQQRCRHDDSGRQRLDRIRRGRLPGHAPCEWLPGRRRPGARQPTGHGAAADDPDDLRDDGVRADRGLSWSNSSRRASAIRR